MSLNPECLTSTVRCEGACPIESDPDTVTFFLKIDGPQVVLFQAIFETYEGVGTVRTLDIRSSLISVITTKDQAADCQRLLGSIRKEFSWECAAHRVELINASE